MLQLHYLPRKDCLETEAEDGLVKLCSRAHDVAEAQKGQEVVDFSSLQDGTGLVDLKVAGASTLNKARRILEDRESLAF